jgi:YVTN family beta-propeller protein
VAGHVAYLSSNQSSTTRVIDLKTGRVVATIPVGEIEDSVYDPKFHTLWLANWTNGNMTIVNTKTRQVVATIHNAEGGGFDFQNMMASPGGFMQLAVGPHGRHVYAASFSGNILVYNAATQTFDKNIPIPLEDAKLSGIAIDPSGRYAYTTVENHHETVTISLKTDKMVSQVQGLSSNRWFVIHR